jgi:hypothetical protein
MPGEESIDETLVIKDPTLEYASSINPTIFHRLRVSKRCVD